MLPALDCVKVNKFVELYFEKSCNTLSGSHVQTFWNFDVYPGTLVIG